MLKQIAESPDDRVISSYGMLSLCDIDDVKHNHRNDQCCDRNHHHRSDKISAQVYPVNKFFKHIGFQPLSDSEKKV